jgi:hypothetical protein
MSQAKARAEIKALRDRIRAALKRCERDMPPRLCDELRGYLAEMDDMLAAGRR